MRHTEVLAYMAGIIDGEGCILIGRKSQGKGKSPRLTLIVNIVNTNEWLIQWIKMQFGGNIRNRFPPNPNAKMIWTWRVESKKAMELLKLVLPYLQIKRPQAELAIQFQSRKRFRGGTLIQRSLTDEEKALNEANQILMHKYNKRGVSNEGQIGQFVFR